MGVCDYAVGGKKGGKKGGYYGGFYYGPPVLGSPLPGHYRDRKLTVPGLAPVPGLPVVGYYGFGGYYGGYYGGKKGGKKGGYYGYEVCETVCNTVSVPSPFYR